MKRTMEEFSSFETSRLVLRPWRRSDAGDMHEYCSHPEVGPAAGWLPHACMEETMALLEGCLIGNPLAWAIVHKADGRAIGGINLRSDEKRSSPGCYALGYSLSVRHWGLGIMTEAARALIPHAFCGKPGAILLSCYHYPHNARSRRVIEKCGFKFEGVLRRGACLPDGTVFDELCYSITKGEFLEACKSWPGNDAWQAQCNA